MPYEINDYKRLTRGYLKDYRAWQQAIGAWEQEKADIDAELASMPVAVSRYGGEPGGGSGEMNAVERLAERRIKLTDRALSIDTDTRELRRVMKNLETAIRTLDGADSQLVTLHYIDGRTWYDVADALGYSMEGAKQKGYRAIGKIAVVLFGRKAESFADVVLIA